MGMLLKYLSKWFFVFFFIELILVIFIKVFYRVKRVMKVFLLWIEWVYVEYWFFMWNIVGVFFRWF